MKSLCRLFQSVSWYNKQCEDNAKKIIYIASPWHLDVSTFIHLHTSLDASYGFRLMLVEEGLSSYFPKIDTRQHLWNTLKTKKQGFRLIQSYVVAVAGMILRQRFEKKTRKRDGKQERLQKISRAVFKNFGEKNAERGL